MYASSIPTGPPSRRAVAVPTNKPVPMTPRRIFTQEPMMERNMWNAPPILRSRQLDCMGDDYKTSHLIIAICRSFICLFKVVGPTEMTSTSAPEDFFKEASSCFSWSWVIVAAKAGTRRGMASQRCGRPEWPDIYESAYPRLAGAIT